MPRIAMVTFVLACATNLHAFYVGASFVQSDSDFETAVDNFEADDSSWKAFAGFTFLKFFALEGTYRDFGSFEDSSGGNTVAADLEGFDLSARGIVPIGKVIGLFAKVGYANVQQDIDFSAATDFDDDNWELMYAGGFEPP